MINLVRRLPRFRRAYRELDSLAAREKWTRTEIATWQLERLNRLWRHAVKFVPYYERLRDQLNLPNRFSSIADFQQQVPVLSKSNVQENAQQFLSRQHEKGEWKRTGGSTGTPTAVFRSHQAHQTMLRSRYRFYQMWNVDIFDRWVFLWGHAASFRPGLPGWVDWATLPIVDRLRNRRRLSAYELSPDDLQRHLQRIHSFRPAAIYAYSTAGHLLAQQARLSGFQFDALKIVNLTAEPVLPHMVKSVEQSFGVPAVVEYGSVECGFLAGEWPDRTLRIREDDILAESLPRDDGRYDIVLTVLGNPSFPLIRYAIDDITDAPIQQPQRGFAVLNNVTGRQLDMVVTGSGQRLHALVLEHIFQESRVFRRWNIHQAGDGAVLVKAESPTPVSNGAVAKLHHRLERLLDGFSVRIDVVEQLPPTPAGKHRSIVSELAAQSNTASAESDGTPAELTVHNNKNCADRLHRDC